MPNILENERQKTDYIDNESITKLPDVYYNAAGVPILVEEGVSYSQDSDPLPKILELTLTEANAIMDMLDSEIETIFTYGSINPIADWENVDLYAYRLLAYKKYKQWYKDTYGEENE